MEPLEDLYFSRVASIPGTPKMASVPVVSEHHPLRLMATRCSSAELKGGAG